MLTPSIRSLSLNRERGSALLIAVVLTAIMAVAALFAYQSTTFQNRTAERSIDYFQALNIAEAGAELAMVELNRPATSNPAAWIGWSGTTEKSITSAIKDDNDKTVGETKVTVSDLSSNKPVITATGFIPNVKDATVKRTVQIVGKNDTIPSPFGGFGIFGFSSVSFSGNANVNSYNAATGAENTGHANIGSLGNITFTGGQTQIYGNVEALGTISNKGTVTGQKNAGRRPTTPPEIPFPNFTIPSYSKDNNSKISGITPPAAGAVLNVPANGTATLQAPGTYYLSSVSLGNNGKIKIAGEGEVSIIATSSFNMNGSPLEIDAKAKVTIQSQNVDVGDLKLGNNAALTVIAKSASLSRNMDLGNGSLKYYIEGGLTVNGSSGINSNGKPSQLQIFAKGTNITFNGSSTFAGGIYAPNADLTLNGSPKMWKGALIANNITIHGTSQFVIEEGITSPQGGDGVYANAWVEVKPKS